MLHGAATQWQLSSEAVLPLDRPRIMGILNTTPDSFSDGGRYTCGENAIDAGLAMVDDGADIIDVGGESTRPGADRIDESTQIDRVVQVIEGIRRRTSCPITIDTTRVAVAEAALDAGATAINDVSGGQDSQMAMIDLAVSRSCGLVLMHWDSEPQHARWSHEMDDEPGPEQIVGTVIHELEARATSAVQRGMPREMVMIDPGLGFGKSVAENVALMGQMTRLHATGWPVLLGASRKSFLGAVTGIDDPRDRDPASIAAAVVMLQGGGRVFRVHDVAGHRQALDGAWAIALSPLPRGLSCSAQDESQAR